MVLSVNSRPKHHANDEADSQEPTRRRARRCARRRREVVAAAEKAAHQYPLVNLPISKVEHPM
jgi:hypothetical protein